MKRGSDLGSRQKRSSNEADELCGTPRSSQITETSKMWRTPAMNGARNGPRDELAFGVTYQFLNGTTHPDPIGSADSSTPPITIGMPAPSCVRSRSRSPACHRHWAPTCSPRTATMSLAFGAVTPLVVTAAAWYQRTDGSGAPLRPTTIVTSARGGATGAAGSTT